MNHERSECGEQDLDCGCLIPLSHDIDPPAEQIPVKYINVNGREEHEALLRDEAKMLELGLDPIYEKIVYLKRWGGWLNEQ
jgi:hypothetical protein